MIRAVLFDLDGTLLNTLEDLADAVNFALQQEGYPIHPLEKYKYFVGSGVHNLLLRALPASHSSDEAAHKLRVHFNNYYGLHSKDKTRPYDGITELLEQLKAKGIKTAVVTNKYDAGAQALVQEYFGPFILATFGQKEGVPIKPHPAQALQAMQDFGVAPEECLFVGDSDVDMFTGANAGSIPVGVLWGFRTKEELLSSGAKHIVSNPKQILDLVNTI